MAEYLFKLHGKSGSGAWWPEADEREASDRASTIAYIEQLAGDGYDLACVFAITCEEGKYAAENVTESFLEELSARETERLVEKFHEGDHDFGSLAGYLEMADRRFPAPARRVA